MARPNELPRLTTVSRLKAIVSFVARTRGEAAARELLAHLAVHPSVLADETRPLSMTTFRKALAWLSQRSPMPTWRELVDDVVSKENLGAFTALLRGASTVGEAFSRLDELAPKHWETVETGRRHWHGRLRLHAPGELAKQALGAELAAIPRLFGLPRGNVEHREPDEFIVRWREPSPTLGLSMALASTLFSLVATMNVELAGAWMIPTAVGLASSALALSFTRGRRRRIESRAQRLRIQVLERAMALPSRSREGSLGFVEGAVLADEYLLGERLGAGANGVIFRATRLSDEATVAIKLLRTAAADDPLAADRLRREAEALLLSQHPNVVALLDHGLLPDGTAYLVLEHLEGESLASKLEREGPLSPEDLAPIALALSDALVAVHAAGVVHRDLKPSNVFLSRDPSGALQAKLLDFGIAHVSWAETRLTELGRPLGTVGYMSPEQAEGRKVDARSDVFSLGALLHECLTGRRPNEIVERPIRERPSGVEKAANALPPSFRELIEKATATLPDERFRDARRMKEAILTASLAEKTTAAAEA